MDLSNIDYESFFKKYISLNEKINSEEYRAFCPFHSDTKKPNLHINIKNGLWYCFVCQEGGNVVDFYKKYTHKTAKDFAVEFNIPFVDNVNVDEFHSYLLKDTKLQEYLIKERGLDLDIIKYFKIGYNDKNNRYTIPIYDKHGIIVNVRQYKRNDDIKMISWKKGYGSIQIFPLEILLNNNKLVLCEGEWDALLLNKKGFPAITVTGGAGSFKEEWVEEYNIKNKEIYIIFDCDKAGRNGSKKIAKLLSKHNKIKIIDLGLKNKEDITDWFVKYGYSERKLLDLINDTEYFVSKEEEEEYINTILSFASNEEYYNKKISFKSIVAGKDLAPYQIPKIVEIECYNSGKYERCIGCPLSENGFVKLVINDYEIISELINVNNMQKIGIIRKKAHIPKCQFFKIKKEIKQNIEEIKLIPEIEFSDDDYEYVVRKAYFIGNNIKTNQTYKLYGTTIPDPKNQQVIHIINKAIPTKDNIEEFSLTNDIKEKLSIFKVEDGDIGKKLKEIYTDLSYNVTHIYNREDLLLAYDLVFHSVLNFNFINEEIKKGWLEVFVIGDSRTGKSKTIEKIINHYKAGERISAENTSLAGLVAGLQQTQKRWTLMWGKIPLNDKRLLVIDEASGLTQDDFSQLSDIRSSGIVEINKIQIQKTQARTRLIFIANPIHKRLIEYSYGVLSLKEVIGKNEDIARFDFALSVSDIDVSDININTIHTEKIEHKYTSELCNLLVMFAWSRKNKHIKFTKDAIMSILEYSNKLSKDFDKSIPLIQGAEIRIKLAKMSVALATRLYNTDNSGENVIVTEDHVEFIVKYLYNIYSKYGFDYLEYSKQRKKETFINDTSKLDDIFTEESVVELFLDRNRLTISDISDILNKDKKETRNIINILIKERALKKSYSYYVKTSAFIVYLKIRKKILQEDKNETENLFS